MSESEDEYTDHGEFQDRPIDPKNDYNLKLEQCCRFYKGLVISNQFMDESIFLDELCPLGPFIRADVKSSTTEPAPEEIDLILKARKTSDYLEFNDFVNLLGKYYTGIEERKIGDLIRKSAQLPVLNFDKSVKSIYSSFKFTKRQLELLATFNGDDQIKLEWSFFLASIGGNIVLFKNKFPICANDLDSLIGLDNDGSMNHWLSPAVINAYLNRFNVEGKVKIFELMEIDLMINALDGIELNGLIIFPLYRGSHYFLIYMNCHQDSVEIQLWDSLDIRHKKSNIGSTPAERSLNMFIDVFKDKLSGLNVTSFVNKGAYKQKDWYSCGLLLILFCQQIILGKKLVLNSDYFNDVRCQIAIQLFYAPNSQKYTRPLITIRTPAPKPQEKATFNTSNTGDKNTNQLNRLADDLFNKFKSFEKCNKILHFNSDGDLIDSCIDNETNRLNNLADDLFQKFKCFEKSTKILHFNSDGDLIDSCIGDEPKLHNTQADPELQLRVNRINEIVQKAGDDLFLDESDVSDFESASEVESSEDEEESESNKSETESGSKIASDDELSSSDDESNSSDNDEISVVKRKCAKKRQPFVPNQKALSEAEKLFTSETGLSFEQASTRLEKVCRLKEYCQDDDDLQIFDHKLIFNGFSHKRKQAVISVAATHSCLLRPRNQKAHRTVQFYNDGVDDHLFFVDGKYSPRRRPVNYSGKKVHQGHCIACSFFGRFLVLMNLTQRLSNIEPEFSSLNLGVKNILEQLFKNLIRGSQTSALSFVTFIAFHDKLCWDKHGNEMGGLASDFAFSILLPTGKKQFKGFTFLFEHKQGQNWGIASKSLSNFEKVEKKLRKMNSDYVLFKGVDREEITQIEDYEEVVTLLDTAIAQLAACFNKNIDQDCLVIGSGDCQNPDCDQKDLDFRYELPKGSGDLVCGACARCFVKEDRFRTKTEVELHNLRLLNKQSNYCVLCERDVSVVQISSPSYSTPSAQVLCTRCYQKLYKIDGTKIDGWSKIKCHDENISIIKNDTDMNNEFLKVGRKMRNFTDDDHLCMLNYECGHSRRSNKCPGNLVIVYNCNSNSKEKEDPLTYICNCCATIFSDWKNRKTHAHIEDYHQDHRYCLNNVEIAIRDDLRKMRNFTDDDHLCMLNYECGHSRRSNKCPGNLVIVYNCNSNSKEKEDPLTYICGCCRTTFGNWKNRKIHAHIEDYHQDHEYCLNNVEIAIRDDLRKMRVIKGDDLCMLNYECGHSRRSNKCGPMEFVYNCNSNSKEKEDPLTYICHCCATAFSDWKNRKTHAHIEDYHQDHKHCLNNVAIAIRDDLRKMRKRKK